jgi:hypothetical protein
MSDDGWNLPEDPTRWEIMEEWLKHHVALNDHKPFTCRDLAASLEISTPEATHLIQAYLMEQGRTKTRAKFDLKRKGRTRAALWSVGSRRKDLVQIDRTFLDDTKVKARRSLEPQLRQIARLNPQLAKEVERQLDGALEGAFMVMASALRL